MRNLPRVSKTALACHLVGLGIAEDGAVAESVTLYAALCSQEVGHRVLRGHPPLERHSTGARQFQPIAVRRQLAHRRRQHAVRTVERKEFFQIRGEAHGLLNHLIRPQQQRLGKRRRHLLDLMTMRSSLKRKRERERRAGAQLTLDPDSPAVELRQNIVVPCILRRCPRLAQ